MIEEHPIFKSPSNPNQKIWRYIDFTKFVDLLNSQSLYFTRADKFEDIFEGSVPIMTAELRNKRMLEMIKNQEVLPKYSPEFWEELGRKSREEYAINCWHMNDYESAAMWKLYLKSNEGIAVQSNYYKLISSLQPTEKRIFIGVVNYIDYEKEVIDWNNSFNPYVHKRKSFAHENELRAIIWKPIKSIKRTTQETEWTEGGIKIKIDLNSLVENIFVSPDSAEWLTDLVKDTCDKFGFSFNVINSRLNDTPVF